MIQPVGVGRSMIRPFVLSAVAAVLAFAAEPAVAQEPIGRPTVGLVLSGGAAKGIAHVGALRVIEAAGIPVDVVTGTSMGSIVGGLYALGYTVDDLEDLVRGRDWTGLFTDAVDRRDIAPETRFGHEAVLLSLPLVDGKPSLPSGLIGGQKIFELLAELTWPYQDVRDFTRLPRPFAAVAVDATTGEPVRIDRGSLALVIRASMSIPSAFKAVEIDGRRYLDGGVARNLPAEDAQALGADVLVCVDVSSVADDEDDPGSFIDVMMNTAFFQSSRDLEAQRARCDVLILPDVDELGPTDFGQAATWMERGRTAAEAVRPELEALAASLGNPPLDPPPSPESREYRVENIVVRGVEGQAERLVLRRLGIEPPHVVGAEEMAEAIARIYASGEFDLVSYRIDPEDASTLFLDVRAASGDAIGFGFRYDTDYDAALLFSLSLRNHLRFGSTASLDVRLGEQKEIAAMYSGRLGLEGAIALGGRAGFASVPLPVFAGGDQPIISGTLQQYSAQVYAGPVIFEKILTGVGPALRYVRIPPEVGPEEFDTFTQTYGSIAAFATIDSRDRAAFPTSGLRALATGEISIGGEASFRHFSADAEAWIPVLNVVTIGARAAMTNLWGSELPLDHLTFMGGPIVPVLFPGHFFPLHGAKTLEFADAAGQLVALTAQLRLSPSLVLRAMVNAGQVGPEWTFDWDDYRRGGAASAGVLTPLGPVELMVSGESFSDLRVTFTMGRAF